MAMTGLVRIGGGMWPGGRPLPRPKPAFRALSLAAALWLGLAGPGAAQDTDLELVLLADASGSIDAREIAFQRQGYAAAITDPQVLEAIANTAYGSIAVTYVEWASQTGVVVGWTRIATAEQAEVFAAALVARPRQAFGRNAIGTALLDALALIEENDIDGWRRVIDFSGDSVNSYAGPPIAVARQRVLEAGVTINALPILRPDDPGRAHGGLEAAYAERIAGGPNSFVVTAADRSDFAAAVKRKLILEISGLVPEARQLAGHVPEARQLAGHVPEARQVAGDVPEARQVAGPVPEVRQVVRHVPGPARPVGVATEPPDTDR